MVENVLREEMEETEIPENVRQKLWKVISTFIDKKIGDRKNGNTNTFRKG